MCLDLSNLASVYYGQHALLIKYLCLLQEVSSQLSVQKGKVDELESALHRVQGEYNESQELVELIERERNVSALLRVKVVDMLSMCACTLGGPVGRE